MGEKQTKPFQLSFNGSLKVDFQGSHVTSDGGLILVRELDERLGLGELIDEHLSDSRQGTNKQFTLADLLRQSVYSRLAGYEDLNDAERVSADPTFRLIGSKKLWDRGAALIAEKARLRPDDLGLVRTARRSHNQLGLAYQIAFIRLTGRATSLPEHLPAVTSHDGWQLALGNIPGACPPCRDGYLLLPGSRHSFLLCSGAFAAGQSASGPA